jgi:adenylate cyclase
MEQMRYRTKLFLIFILMVLISTITALSVIYHGTNQLVLNQMRSKLLSIGVTAVAGINGDILQTWSTQESVNTPAYKALIEQLRKLRDLNRRSDVFVRYTYIVRKAGVDRYTFIADAEESVKDASLFGDPAPIPSEAVPHLGDFPFVTTKPYKDPWGQWLTVYVPIYNTQEKVVAILAMDIALQYLKEKIHKLIIYGISALAGSLLVALLVASILSNIVTSSLQTICQGITSIRLGDLNTRVYLNTDDEFNELAKAINEMVKNIKEKERLTVAFGRYVSHHVLETILHSNHPTHLEGERKKVTVLFCDIHQFNLISETLPPEVVVSLLNEYLEKMISIIFAHQGTLDKFFGDGIMAEFGVPLEDSNQEIHAIETALDMQATVAQLSQRWKQEHNGDITIGIGIHTGLAVVGNIGSNIRMEYTAIGDTVNVASRLEKVTKTLGVPILISEETYQSVSDTQHFQYKDFGLIKLYGRENPIRVYAILPLNPIRDESL